MTLFGSSKHHKNDERATLEKPRHGHHNDANVDGMQAGGMGSQPLGGSTGMNQGYAGTGTGATGMAGTGMTDPYDSTGMTGHHNATNIPPTSTVNHGEHTHQSGGAGTRITGKVESALGTMVGSTALKAKGIEKEREANAVKLQSTELAEAERLEREALMRRERAVAHGAHPANSALGAGTGHMHQGQGQGQGQMQGGQY